ncbi:Transcriptional regulator, TetR family [Candidatus Promineifilum breve]|uniref:Transcriptional regulator, TetR family n=1 Tax=Candidatus Promineifilum breve TaxID=1806508 RepID=A0A160T338_9CHLR|nr:TetR/AcrR family transcriptional regulator [Candidatus Promineifilum breve]CUS03358.2 Transcriptional regulator, TetR family [Candidatus Promineifilum breve]
MKSEIAPKDQLFQTAAQLFYRHGYRATGVDTIAAESGIGKMTLYRHYPSKDDLIVAYLRDSDALFWRGFEQITAAAPTPRAKLLAFFVALQSYVMSDACYGCPFLNAAAEYPDPDHPAHRVAVEHKRIVGDRFRQLVEAGQAPRPDETAAALVLLMDGAYMTSRMFGASPENPSAHLAAAARRLLGEEEETTD